MLISQMVNTRQSTPEFFGFAFDEAMQRAVNTLLPGLTAQITNELSFKQAKKGKAYVATLSWKDFCKAFFLQYFPRYEQQKYEREYHTIRQKDGELTGEFMKQFLRNYDGDRIQSANKNNNQRVYGQRGNDGRNYDRQGGNSSQRFYQQNWDQQYNRSSGSSRQKKYTDYTSPPPCDTC
nr:hypothetical protein [Tanacetum cinerariifolium]